jgi:hypothetical protein
MKRLTITKRVLMIFGVSTLVLSSILIGSCGGGSSTKSCENKCTMLFGKNSNSQSYRDCIAACLDKNEGTDEDQSDDSNNEEFPINLSVAVPENTNKVALSWNGPADLINADGYQIIRNDQKTDQVTLDETYFEDTPIASGNYCYEVCAHSSGMATGICLSTSNRVCVDVETPIVWSYDTQDTVEIISANASNQVAALTDENTIIQIDSSGSLNWNYTPDAQVISIAIDNSGKVYALTRSTDAVALMAISKEGTFQWQTDAPGGRGPVIIGDDDNIYYLSTDSSNVSLNIVEHDGTPEKAIQVADTGLTTTLCKYNTNFLFGSRNILYALDSNGNVNWKYTASTSISTPAIGRSHVVYFGANQTLVALNGENGGLLWSQDFDTSLYYSKLSASEDDTVYVSLNEVLYALDSDGQSLWIYEANASIGSPLVIASGALFVPSYDGCMILFNQMGNTLWEQCHDSFLNVKVGSVNDNGYGFYSDFSSAIFAIDDDLP